MTHDDYARIALHYHTRIADAFLAALGIERSKDERDAGEMRYRGGADWKYRNARELMQQRHGVRW